MALLEKIKINLDYLLGKANSSLYAPLYKSPKLTTKDWQHRWEVFGNDEDSFIWHGVDSEGNLAEFVCGSAYVPEAFFQDVAANKMLSDFFGDLPEITTSLLPENLDIRLKEFANDSKNTFWKTGANDGLFNFSDTDEDEWNTTRADAAYNYERPPYELLIIPKAPLKINQLPAEIQKLLEPYHFQDLKFAECKLLNVAKYLYCEK